MYERVSFIHPRIAGSTEMCVSSTTNWSSPGSGTCASAISKSEAFTSPTGLAASLTWRLADMATLLGSRRGLPRQRLNHRTLSGPRARVASPGGVDVASRSRDVHDPGEQREGGGRDERENEARVQQQRAGDRA